MKKLFFAIFAGLAYSAFWFLLSWHCPILAGYLIVLLVGILIVVIFSTVLWKVWGI